MNWGKGIIVAFVLFIGFIVFMITSMISTKVDLVSDDYYVREIAYEQEIQALKNSNSAGKFSIKDGDEFVVVSAPDESNFSEILIDMKRPNNDELDQSFEMKDSKTLLIDKNELEVGMYNIELSFKSAGKVCLQKEKIYVQ